METTDITPKSSGTGTVIMTDEVDPGHHYLKVVLREDQFERIREIIRDEVERALRST